MKLPKVNDLRTNKTCRLTRVFSRKGNVDTYNKHQCLKTVATNQKDDSFVCTKCDKSGYPYCVICGYCGYCSYLDFIKTEKFVFIDGNKTTQFDEISYNEYCELRDKIELYLEPCVNSGYSVCTKWKHNYNPNNKMSWCKGWCSTCYSFNCIKKSKFGINVKKGTALCKSSLKNRRRDFDMFIR